MHTYIHAYGHMLKYVCQIRIRADILKAQLTAIAP